MTRDSESPPGGSTPPNGGAPSSDADEHALKVQSRNRGGIHLLTPLEIYNWVRGRKDEDVVGKEAKIPDGGGLRLSQQTRNGVFTWLQDVTIAAPKDQDNKDEGEGNSKPKRKDVKVGSYPADKLEAVRKEADKVKKLAAQGIDPVAFREHQTKAVVLDASRTLNYVMQKWVAYREKSELPAKQTKTSEKGRMNNYIQLSTMWNVPLAMITTPDAFQFLEQVAAGEVGPRGGTEEVARKIRIDLQKVGKWAKTHGLAAVVAFADLEDPDAVKAAKKKGGNQPAIVDMASVGDLMRRNAISSAHWQLIKGVEFCARIPNERSGVILSMQWDHISADCTLWRVPRDDPKVKIKKTQERVKRRAGPGAREDRKFHEVPLCRQMTAFLLSLERHPGGYVLYSPDNINQPVSQAGVQKYLREKLEMRETHVLHGFRSTYSTWASIQVVEEPFPQFRFDKRIIEMSMDHDVETEVSGTYTRKQALILILDVVQAYNDALDVAIAEAEAAARRRREEGA